METLHTLLAALPVLCVIGLILLRVPALYAVVVSIAVALVLGFWFPIEGAQLADRAVSLSTVTVSVMFILLGGIVLSEHLAASGAQDRISDWLGRAAGGFERSMLMVGICVAPLAESLVGFGVGVIIAVPLLTRLGLGLTKAATVGLVGLTMGAWGSLGPGILIASELSGVDFSQLGIWAAKFNILPQLVLGASVAIIGLGAKRALRWAGEWVTASVLMWATLLTVNVWLTPAIAGVLASLVGIIVFLVAAALHGHRPPSMDRVTVRAFLPYGVLTVSMLAVSAFNLVIGFGAWTALLTSPGLWLMVTAAFTPRLVGIARSDAQLSVGRGARLWIPICSVNVLYIMFGTLLSVNGMTAELADQAAGLGRWFVPLIPVIGFLGGYITNSNSGAAAMLAGGLTGASNSLGINSAATLGLQNSTTGFSSMASPSRVELAQRVAQRDATPGGEKIDTVAILRTVLISCGAAVAALMLGAITANALGWLAA
ncbi:lactate permease [Leucobacter exalbidus]|uniref:L-lactate permease n=1 Tax=Leucobacter exalbidus TaxID=662960 RepID=A0A940PMS8_9MICO|nr:L-lactate permease [Leucobacter exalbidus]MBP1326827.1 lactate permease [Leucobacter exalbidus]